MKNYSRNSNSAGGGSIDGDGFRSNGNNCNANETTKLLSGALRITNSKGNGNGDSNDLNYCDEQRMESIRSSIKIGYSSIESGESAKSDIEHQNSVLEDSERNVDSINSMAERAREVIRTWQCNIYRKRLYLWSIAIVLFIIDTSLLVYMMRHHGRLY